MLNPLRNLIHVKMVISADRTNILNIRKLKLNLKNIFK